MPKKLYDNISGEKRNKIFAAALREFSGFEYAEASINRVIKDADISRGSFYQYFEDKEDLYFYLVDQILRKRLESLTERLERTSSLSSEAIYEEFFLLMLSMLSNPACKDFFCKLYASMTYGFGERLRVMIAPPGGQPVHNQAHAPGNNDAESISRIFWLITNDLLAEKAIRGLTNEQALVEYSKRKAMIKAAK